MAHLYFRYGAMTASKSLNLLVAAHTYEAQGKDVLCFTPALDTRHGVGTIGSRIGVTREAIPVYEDTNVYDVFLDRNMRSKNGISCVFSDESNLYKKKHIEQFAQIVDELDTPAILYGLKNDFKNELFEGSYWLLALADKIEEIKTTCAFCEHKAHMALRLVNGKAVYDGPQVQIGDSDYMPVCRACYKRPPRDFRCT